MRLVEALGRTETGLTLPGLPVVHLLERAAPLERLTVVVVGGADILTTLPAALALLVDRVFSSRHMLALAGLLVEPSQRQETGLSTRSRLPARSRFTLDDPLQPRHSSRPCLA
jgi:hypothetical protein